MAVPNSRSSFKEYCLRALGKPVITINVDDTQVEDRIDEALLFWRDHHYNGTERAYVAIQLTQTDIDNRYVAVPPSVLAVTGVFRANSEFTSASDWMSIRYQLRFDDVFSMSREGVQQYYITRTALSTFEHVLTAVPRHRYNMYDGKLHVDYDWEQKWNAGDFMLIECYRAIDASTVTGVWGDRILAKLATAYIKKQWGENLKKFVGVQIAGGVQLNADAIYQSAIQDIEKLEADFIMRYQMPDEFAIG